jgi:hypothetical protein
LAGQSLSAVQGAHWLPTQTCPRLAQEIVCGEQVPLGQTLSVSVPPEQVVEPPEQAVAQQTLPPPTEERTQNPEVQLLAVEHAVPFASVVRHIVEPGELQKSVAEAQSALLLHVVLHAEPPQLRVPQETAGCATQAPPRHRLTFCWNAPALTMVQVWVTQAKLSESSCVHEP